MGDECCWLCLNCSHPEAKKMSTFVTESVSSMSVESMAEIISEHLHAADPERVGISRAAVQRHIQCGHLLSPALQMAHTLRSLFKLRDTIYGMIISEDEGGALTVDTKNMASYLKVISEIRQVYTSRDADRLMYGKESKKEGDFRKET